MPIVSKRSLLYIRIRHLLLTVEAYPNRLLGLGGLLIAFIVERSSCKPFSAHGVEESTTSTRGEPSGVERGVEYPMTGNTRQI